jgi:hypothetical protein
MAKTQGLGNTQQFYKDLGTQVCTTLLINFFYMLIGSTFTLNDISLSSSYRISATKDLKTWWHHSP